MTTGQRRRYVRGWVGLALIVTCAVLVGLRWGERDRTWAAAGAATRVSCRQSAQDAGRRAALVTGNGPRVLVIGDSWATGYGLRNPALAWPRYLPGEVHVAGFDGSGFTRRAIASKCGPVDYVSRARTARSLRPQLVVVEGGLNDADAGARPMAVQRDAELVVRSFPGARVVLIAPPRAPALRGAVLPIDRALARAATATGAQYVSPDGWRLQYISDGVHLTAAGHREFGSRVAAAMKSASWSTATRR